jgi:hypothetical protein
MPGRSFRPDRLRVSASCRLPPDKRVVYRCDISLTMAPSPGTGYSAKRLILNRIIIQAEWVETCDIGVEMFNRNLTSCAPWRLAVVADHCVVIAITGTPSARLRCRFGVLIFVHTALASRSHSSVMAHRAGLRFSSIFSEFSIYPLSMLYAVTLVCRIP